MSTSLNQYYEYQMWVEYLDSMLMVNSEHTADDTTDTNTLQPKHQPIPMILYCVLLTGLL
jgi:hypothetical protein